MQNYKFNRSIAIVEDVGDLKKILVRKFTMEGFCVEGFESAACFIKDFYPNKYGGIIIDINLEKAEAGLNLIEFIRKIDERVTILAYSGDYNYLHDDRIKELAISHFLMKPFTLEEITNKTKKAMEFNHMYYSNLEELDFIKKKYLELICEI